MAATDWMVDFEAAKTRAEKERKLLLVNFTGSDWCGYCIKLHDEVFSKSTFLDQAKSSYVLVEVDQPRQKVLPAKLLKQNQRLNEAYSVEGFPTILLMDSLGRPFAKTGYVGPVGPAGYLTHLQSFDEARQEHQKLWQSASNAKGVEKAQAYETIIQWLTAKQVPVNLQQFVPAMRKADPKDELGKIGLYEDRLAYSSLVQKLHQGTVEEAVVMLEAFVKEDRDPSVRYVAFLQLAGACHHTGDLEKTISALKGAVETVPDHPRNAQLTAAISQLEAEVAKGPQAEAAKRHDCGGAGAPCSH